MIIKNGIVIVENNERTKIKGYELRFESIFKGKINFTVLDGSKYAYEKGYETHQSRKLSKNKTIRFKGLTIDLSKLNGMENI